MAALHEALTQTQGLDCRPMALCHGQAGLRRRLKHLLAAVPLALVIGMASPDATASVKPSTTNSVAQSSSADKFVPSINEFSDVTNPEHWAYRDLKELIDIYQCVAGFPDKTFKGEEPATRFEVAALLKACLDSGISIHEEKHPTTQSNTPTPAVSIEHEHEGIVSHPHKPAEHKHDTVADHKHLIDPAGHKHEDIVPHPHEPTEHEHPINPYILISIVIFITTFIIYQSFMFAKIRELEKCRRNFTEAQTHSKRLDYSN